MRKFIWVILLWTVSLLGAVNAGAQPSEEKTWTIYEMKLVQMRDEAGMPWAYVIGYSAFRTVDGLKEWVAQIPEGNTLKWDKGSDIPIAGDPLGSAEAAEDFTKFCEARKIKLEFVPRP